MIVKLPTMVSVAGMARMVGLSRQRFHQLMREGVFPPPIYDTATKRPHYTEDMQQICMTVREQNVGVNGRVVLFYVRRPESAPKKQISSFGSARRKKLHQKNLIDGLKGLGLSNASEQSIASAMQELYPKGTTNVDEAEVLRTIFVHMMRRN
jgi:hypothetical protein